ncbi:pseudouridine synthase [Rheinheimera sp.]|uniref:pseudouridine synthase n=1 Tax=Rheinheimera sp. TaxID=1869214 RepID=UPI002FDD463A
MSAPAFNLVFSHDDFVVLNKAPGVSFHSEQGAGLVVQAEQALGFALYPVHRLDKVTSGLILFARSPQAAARLSALFQTQQMQKFYLALSGGKVQKKQGWVKGDMAPARRGAYKLLTSQQNPAVSYFISAGFANVSAAEDKRQSCIADTVPAGIRLYLIKPFSGKTHQIRVALKSVSAPILGDELYQAAAADRVYLHAYALCFKDGGTEWQFVQRPDAGHYFLTEAVQQQLEIWDKPWQLSWPQYQMPEVKKLSGIQSHSFSQPDFCSENITLDEV